MQQKSFSTLSNLYNELLCRFGSGKAEWSFMTYYPLFRSHAGMEWKRPDSELGLQVGQLFMTRGMIFTMGLHSSHMKGISARRDGDGFVCDAVACAGTYNDDQEVGEGFIYSGETLGPTKKRQSKSQGLTQGNSALWTAFLKGQPVRAFSNVEKKLIVSSQYRSREGEGLKWKTASESVNVHWKYDGMFQIASCWMGKSVQKEGKKRKREDDDGCDAARSKKKQKQEEDEDSEDRSRRQCNVWKFKMMPIGQSPAPTDSYLPFKVYISKTDPPPTCTRNYFDDLASKNSAVGGCGTFAQLRVHIGVKDSESMYLACKTVGEKGKFVCILITSSFHYPPDLFMGGGSGIIVCPKVIPKDLSRGGEMYPLVVEEKGIPAADLEKVYNFAYCPHNIVREFEGPDLYSAGLVSNVKCALAWQGEPYGVGLKVLQDVKKGDYMFSLNGLMVTADYGDILATKRNFNEYFSALNRQHDHPGVLDAIDQGSVGNLTRWINHCGKNPNIEVDSCVCGATCEDLATPKVYSCGVTSKDSKDKVKEVRFKAKCDITRGEFLMWNYGKAYWSDKGITPAVWDKNSQCYQQ